MYLNVIDLHQLESYDYFLPKGRIAQHPVSPRDASKLLFVYRERKSFSDDAFLSLPDLLHKGDLLVLNNTKVIPARLQSDQGEVLLVRPTENQCWDAMVYPGKHFEPGTTIEFPGGMSAVVLTQSRIGRILHFHRNLEAYLRKHGSMPLPPYIERPVAPNDRTSYQTIYARKAGSVAAPTAGLHFTRQIFAALKQRGIDIAKLTLHVGPGTFQPVKSLNITQHSIHSEYYECSESCWQKIRNAKRVIAVGTTTTRAVETIARTGRRQGVTDLFIYPGFSFEVIGGLLTNFHLPRSSLLMLVSAFGGYDLIRRAYEHAIDSGYRFYSYGDAMLLL